MTSRIQREKMVLFFRPAHGYSYFYKFYEACYRNTLLNLALPFTIRVPAKENKYKTF